MIVETQESVASTLEMLHEGINTILILDSGRDPNILKTVFQYEQNVQFYPLMDPKTYGDAAYKGPIIVHVPHNSNFIDYFLHSPLAGLLLLTAKSFEETIVHCRKIFIQVLDFDQTLFRFYDIRVFSDLATFADKKISLSIFKNIIFSYIGVSENGDIIKFSPSFSAEDVEIEQITNFKLTDNIIESLNNAYDERILCLLSAYLLDELDSYNTLSDDQKISFLKSAVGYAREFGIKDFDDLTMFSTSWFYTQNIMEQSQEAMTFLRDITVAKPDKISFLYYQTIFSYNGSPFAMCPIATLARSGTYSFFPNRHKPNGDRLLLDLINENDRIPRMYYSSQYQKYQPKSSAIFKIYRELIASESFSPLSVEYNPYSSRFAFLEDKLSDRIKKELSRGL